MGSSKGIDEVEKGSGKVAEGAQRRITEKEESFCVARASGASNAEAYTRCYTWNGKPSAAAAMGARIEGRLRVEQRIKELRDQYAKSAVEASRGLVVPTNTPAYTKADAHANLTEAMDAARMEVRPSGPMTKVIEVLMRLHGLGIGDAKNPSDKEEMPVEHLEAALLQLQQLKESRGTKH